MLVFLLQAVAAALPLLLEKGLVSDVKEVQALAIDTIAKVVKAAGPEQVGFRRLSFLHRFCFIYSNIKID